MISTGAKRLDRPDTLEEALSELEASRKREAALRDELKRLQTEYQEFIYIASHDLQAPLRKLSAFGDRLRSGSSDALDERSRHYLERMGVAVVRMQRMLDGLLDVSRVTTRRGDLTNVRLSEAMESVRKSLELEGSWQGAEIEVEVGDLAVRVNEKQLVQLLCELIRNAVRFSRKKASPQVSVRARDNGAGQVELTVRDNGMGFDPAHTDTMFNMFQRLHLPEDDEPGCGAGLTISKRIVEVHGGEIRAEGSPDAGATVTVTLPIASSG